jgi:hypothetical protein
MSSPPLHPDLKGTNSIDLKGKGDNFFPSPVHIKFYGASNKLNFTSAPIPSPPLTHLVEHSLRMCFRKGERWGGEG